MKIVIEMTPEKYKALKEMFGTFPILWKRWGLQAIYDGIVLPEYEHHIDHTDCIWYGNNSGCPVTCSQYRDGWNDAMDYIFKGGKGYQPYRRDE